MKAIIFAAGLGTRIQSVTKEKPKALLEINGKALIEYAIEYLLNYGIESIIINLHHQADMIETFVRQLKYTSKITFSDERERLLDTGGGLLKAKSFFDSDSNFIAMNVDVLTNLNLSKMIQFHENHNAVATLAVRKRETSRYLLFDNSNKMIGWENIKTQERIIHADVGFNPLAFSGIHIISPKIWSHLEQQTETQFSITPAYVHICKHETIMGFEHSNGYWYDVGKPETYRSACQQMI